MGNQSRIIRLFQAAGGKEEEKKWPSLLLLIFLSAFLSAATTYMTAANFILKTQAEAVADSERSMKNVTEKELKMESRRVLSVRLYPEKLPIESLKVRNRKGVLIVTGRIKNKGRREVRNIELTVYILDEDENAVFEAAYVPESDNGLPLKPGQCRPFTVNISPSTVSDSQFLVIITDIQFEGSNEMKKWKNEM